MADNHGCCGKYVYSHDEYDSYFDCIVMVYICDNCGYRWHKIKTEEEMVERVGDILYDLAVKMGTGSNKGGWALKPTGYDNRRNG